MFGLIRLIPHLRHFIKEMYRLDQESPITHKKRFLYRTILAVLFLILIGVIGHDFYYSYGYRNQIKALNVEIERLHKLEVLTDREQKRTDAIEKENGILKYANDRIEVKLEMAVDIIEHLCDKDKEGCPTHVQRFIDRENTYLLKRKHEDGEKELNIDLKK